MMVSRRFGTLGAVGAASALGATVAGCADLVTASGSDLAVADLDDDQPSAGAHRPTDRRGRRRSGCSG